MMKNALEYLDTNDDQALQELQDFLRHPSVSTDPERKPAVAACAEWLAGKLKEIGLPTVEIHPTDGHPIVYAEDLSAGPDKPTVLMYGHYDVQPVDPIELWTNDPFDPIVRDGKVFARGATDDKGQVWVHVKAVQAMLANGGTLPVNLKMLIEGEEEVGSPNLTPYVKEQADRLACDAVVVSDSAMFAPGRPSIVYGLRGLAYVEIHVDGPNRDLHSGSYGGPVRNPLNTLCEIIASMKDETGRVTIDGFYDGVPDLDEQERRALDALGYSVDRLQQDVGQPDAGGERGYSIVERLWTRPTLDVNGILGGFTGEGAKTVLPAKAMAKVSMRLVPHQEHHDIVAKITAHVRSVTPPGVTVTVKDLHGADPVLVPLDAPALKAADKALSETYDQPCLYQREGGSIPVVELFGSVLNVPTVLMGFGLSNENAHSPDEHFALDNFYKGMRASVRFYHEMAELKRS